MSGFHYSLFSGGGEAAARKELKHAVQSGAQFPISREISYFYKKFTMNNYLEFNFNISPLQPWNEILMAELIEIGFDSFTEEHNGILAYIQKDLFDDKQLQEINMFSNEAIEISYTYQEMPNINWNEEWEKNFEPINVENQVSIRRHFLLY